MSWLQLQLPWAETMAFKACTTQWSSVRGRTPGSIIQEKRRICPASWDNAGKHDVVFCIRHHDLRQTLRPGISRTDPRPEAGALSSAWPQAGVLLLTIDNWEIEVDHDGFVESLPTHMRIVIGHERGVDDAGL
jgi:hypothetical protein